VLTTNDMLGGRDAKIFQHNYRGIKALFAPVTEARLAAGPAAAVDDAYSAVVAAYAASDAAGVTACEVGVVKWVRCFTMAEVLGRVQPPNVPQAAARQVVGKPALGAHPRASVLSARGPRRTSQNGACTSPHKSPLPSSPQQRVPTTRPTNQVHTSTKHTTSA